MAAAPIAKEVADEIRNKFTALATDTSKYYDADLERIKSDDKLVSRFLAHQRDDTDEAAKMIESVFAWRKENSIRDLDYSKDPDKALTIMYFRGKDSDGTDVLWVEPKAFDKNKRREFEKYLMWLVENRPGEAECSQITIVLALSDVGLTEADVDFIKYFINLFMYYTADVMKKMLIHNMHWLLNGIWKLVSVLLSEGAKKRVIFVKNKEINKHIPEASVLACCGGPDPYRFQA
ncbi:hypothetical protein ACHWQZ_G004607 [Mnemiopsis leidyi]